MRGVLTGALCGAVLVAAASTVSADTVFLYASTNTIRGINLDTGVDSFLTTSPFPSANALAVNGQAGLVYYGNGTISYVWDMALGSSAAAHSVLNDFATGPVTAPIHNLNSAAGDFLNGTYYLGSEAASGEVEELYAVTMSADGRSTASVSALGLLSACGCTGTELGGFGDLAAVDENGVSVLYGSTAAIGGASPSSGRWRFVPSTGIWTLLSAGNGGQMSGATDGSVYSNSGTSVRTVDKLTGALGSTSLFTTVAEIWDFTSGFTLDFGDSPSSYGGAMHALPLLGPPTVRLGSVPPDNEAGTLNAASGGGATNGQGDDSLGIDDEDALSGPLTLDDTVTDHSIYVSCTPGTRVAGWIDFDRNGTFSATERSSASPMTCGAGTTQLRWLTIGGMVAGDSYLRLRVASNGAQVESPTGYALDGEVEDYPLTITAGGVPPVSGSCPAGDVSATYAASGLPMTIPGNTSGNTNATISVPDSLTITDVNVSTLRGTHAWVSDMTFTLLHGGAESTLWGAACGSNDDFDFAFDDDGTSGNPPCPPTDGVTYPPDTPLSVFDGQDASGIWTLRMFDSYPQDGGSLQAWALEICSTPAPAANPDIRVGKSALVEGREVEFTLAVANTGDAVLDNVSLVDDLDVTFGAGHWTLLGVPLLESAPAGITIATGYTGSGSNTELLGAGNTLAPGESVRLSFRVRVDDLAGATVDGGYLNSASASGATLAGAGANDDSGPGLDLGTDTDAPTSFTIGTAIALGGHVFLDASDAAASSHDGLVDAAEAGLADRAVTIVTLAGDTVATALTDAEGRWSIDLPASLAGETLDVVVTPMAATPFVSESPTRTTGSVTDGKMRLTPALGDVVTDLDTGVVANPSFAPDRIETVPAGTAVLHSHVFIAPTHGRLSLTSLAGGSATATAWATRVVLDTDCDGSIDAGETAYVAPVDLAKDETLCIVVERFVPAEAVAGDRGTLSLDAGFAVADAAGTGHGAIIELGVQDLATVAAAAAGRLLLDKRVRNVTLGEAEGVNNEASPGDTLEYTIGYENRGSGPIDDLLINDRLPAYTGLVPGSLVCGTTPASLACTPANSVDNLEWRFVGTLGGGERGSVRYRVTVD